MAHQEYYDSTGLWYPSVTTVLGGTLPKPALVSWIVKQVKEGKDPDEIKADASDRGNKFHDVLEDYLGGKLKAEDITPEERTACLALKRGLVEYGVPIDIAAPGIAFREGVEVLSEQHFAEKFTIDGALYPVSGTCDLILYGPSIGQLGIDFKTSNNLYTSTWLQIAGYDMLKWGQGETGTTAYGVLHIDKISGSGNMYWTSDQEGMRNMRSSFITLLKQFHQVRRLDQFVSENGLNVRKGSRKK